MPVAGPAEIDELRRREGLPGLSAGEVAKEAREEEWRKQRATMFVPEDPDAYRDRTIAAVGSYHYEFQRNRTAVKVSIPNGMLEAGCPLSEGATVEAIGMAVYKAARKAKNR
jgi:hypothetical protein